MASCIMIRRFFYSSRNKSNKQGEINRSNLEFFCKNLQNFQFYVSVKSHSEHIPMMKPLTQ